VSLPISRHRRLSVLALGREANFHRFKFVIQVVVGRCFLHSRLDAGRGAFLRFKFVMLVERRTGYFSTPGSMPGVEVLKVITFEVSE
jgi:hypothetical protein